MSCHHCGSAHPKSANPRSNSCVKCGRAFHVSIPETHRPRNPQLERELTDLAARSVGFPHDGGLRAFADRRSLPGGVRVDADWTQEACEEVADLANYLVWGMQEHRNGFESGDSEATARYERFARALPHAVAAWYALLAR